jgi:selenoprotein W-related protein
VGADSDLLTNYQHVIGDLRLVAGNNGVFNVAVNGDRIYSKAQTGRHAESGEVLELFTDHIGSDVHRYGEK